MILRRIAHLLKAMWPITAESFHEFTKLLKTHKCEHVDIAIRSRSMSPIQHGLPKTYEHFHYSLLFLGTASSGRVIRWHEFQVLKFRDSEQKQLSEHFYAMTHILCLADEFRATLIDAGIEDITIHDIFGRPIAPETIHRLHSDTKHVRAVPS